MSERDDLTSNFQASLDEAKHLSLDRLAANPTHAAMCCVEGMLESPADAKLLAARVSEAFNALPEGTRQQKKRKTETFKDLRFALAREYQRAKTAYPQRWARVMTELDKETNA